MLDSHQHFWKYNPVRNSWITHEMRAIQRDFLPRDLSFILKENNMDGCVAVQADQSEQETMFLLELAAKNDFIKGVVGWVDLRSEKIKDKLSLYTQFSKLKGFRHIVQSEADGFLLEKNFNNGIHSLREYDFTYDILVYSRQLEDVIKFVTVFPNQKFVIDHLAKPAIKENDFDLWARNMAMLGSFENVYCKLSGMVTEADWKNWKPNDFKPYLDFAFNAFGANRLMYGSDWPVCLVAASYKQQLFIVEEYVSKLSVDEKEMVMGGNAIRFYNL